MRPDLHAVADDLAAMDNAEWEAWLADPDQAAHPALLAAAKRCPLNSLYAIREGAPYSITRPGAIGMVVGYTEDGLCTFAMLAPAYEKRMWQGGTGTQIKDPPVGLKARIRPEHLRPVAKSELEGT